MSKKEINEAFNEWIESDNVIKLKDGYSTQDAQYMNCLSKDELLKYFIKEYINN
jgi:hypothetical protein